MKSFHRLLPIASVSIGIILNLSCSSLGTDPESDSSSQTFHLGEKEAAILAEVPLPDVREVFLRFVQAPLQLDMSRKDDSTWQSPLTQEQIRLLSVPGRTMTYEAHVIARKSDGSTAMVGQPLFISVKAPQSAFSKRMEIG